MRLLLALLFSSLCLANQVRAELVTAEVSGSGHVRSQSIAVLVENNFIFYPANLEKTGNAMLLSGEVPNVKPESLVTGVVVFSDGRVVSSPIRSSGSNALSAESSALVIKEISSLESEVESYRARVEELNGEISKANSQLRKEAGLAEVDAIYARAEELEKQIEALKSK